MDLFGDVGHMESRFCPFGYNVNHRCKIGARFRVKRTKGSESFKTNPMVHLGDDAQVKAQFGPFGDSANLDAR